MSLLTQVPCVDVYPASAFKKADQSLAFKAITLTEAIWQPGSKGKITISFGQYGCSGCSPDAAWSHIGNNSTSEYPSMNLGFIDPPFEPFTYNGKTYTPSSRAMRNYCSKDASGNYQKNTCDPKWKAGATVIHEFCHALGMLHEHQNNLENSNEIQLNEANVIKYYNGIGLGVDGAKTNVLERYGCSDSGTCKYSGTRYDKNSIMLYALPDDWIKSGMKNPTYPNFVLSADDLSWLKEIYPKGINNPPEISVEFIDQNIEPWKVAWVEKTIKETFEPIIGVKWNFLTQPFLGKSSQSVTTTTDTTPNTGSTTQSTTAPIIVPSGAIAGKPLTTPEIVGIVVGCIVGLVLIGSGIFGAVKLSKSKGFKGFKAPKGRRRY